MGVVAFGFSAILGKKLNDYLSEKGDNGESNMDMLVAFGNRMRDYMDDNRDYFKVVLNFLQICTQASLFRVLYCCCLQHVNFRNFASRSN